MIRMVKVLCLVTLFWPALGKAQGEPIRLICPLNEAIVVPPPKNALQFDVPDLCIVLSSIPDTIVKACTGARVTNVVQNEEDGGKWEVVLFRKYQNREYYFWYTGLESVTVKRNEILKEGQAMGYIKSGNRIEFLMYDFETQLDPIKYLDCKGVLKRGF